LRSPLFGNEFSSSSTAGSSFVPLTQNPATELQLAGSADANV
jgi:hypothetical protein